VLKACRYITWSEVIMNNKSLFPYIVVANKMFKIEDNLFQNKSSFLKRILIGIGVYRINMPTYVTEIRELHKKFEEIQDKTNERDKALIVNFTSKLNECIVSLSQIINGLARRSVNIEALDLDEYQKLIADYNLKKLDLIQILEESDSNVREIES